MIVCNKIALFGELEENLNAMGFLVKLQDNNLLSVRASENVVRLLPPLNVKKRVLNLALKILSKVCKDYR